MTTSQGRRELQLREGGHRDWLGQRELAESSTSALWDCGEALLTCKFYAFHFFSLFFFCLQVVGKVRDRPSGAGEREGLLLQLRVVVVVVFVI